MLANANQQPEIAPADQHIRAVTAACQKHGIDHGNPGSLAGFMDALGRDKLLAMNFWSLVAHLTTVAGPQSTNPDWLLAIIVEGVTGRSLAETRAAGSEQSRLVQRLASMLAGEDVDSPLAHTPHPPSRQVDVSGMRRLAIRLTEADRAATPIAQRSPTPIAWPSPQAPSIAGSDRPAEAAPGRGLASLSVCLDATTPNLATNPVYGAAVLMLLVIVGSASFAYSSKSVAWLKVGASAHARHNSADSSSNPPPSVTPAGSAALSGEAAIARAIPSANPAPKAAPTKPARTLVPPPAPEIGHVPEGDASDTANADALVARDADGLIQLPESIMQRNLESSRVPVYPEAAKAAHLEGVVVVHAVVAQDGSVGHLRVVAGDPALRHAALDSVATWHYRPILVQGKPIEVSTTISVDFSQTE
jgi:TonB family protein